MRTSFAVPLLVAVFPLAQQTCAGDSPVITSMQFPDEVTGNGQDVRGNFDFTDGNAGVTYAISAVVVCPEGFECGGGTYNLTEEDPSIDEAIYGTIMFVTNCVNLTGQTVFFTYSWTLVDIEGNVSNTEEYAFDCTALNEARESVPGASSIWITPETSL